MGGGRRELQGESVGPRNDRQALAFQGMEVRKGDLESGNFLILSPGCLLGGQAGMAGH